MTDSIGTIFARLKRLSAEANLPDIEESTSYCHPALKVGGKSFVVVKNNETIVLSISIDDKERLIEMAPDIYYQTDHYVGWPSLPLRASAISDAELKERLTGAWRFRAPKSLAARFRGRARVPSPLHPAQRARGVLLCLLALQRPLHGRTLHHLSVM